MVWLLFLPFCDFGDDFVSWWLGIFFADDDVTLQCVFLVLSVLGVATSLGLLVPGTGPVETTEDFDFFKPLISP